MVPSVPKNGSHTMVSTKPLSFNHLLKLCQSLFFFCCGKTQALRTWQLDSQSFPEPMQSARGQTMVCLSQWKIPDVHCSLTAKLTAMEAVMNKWTLLASSSHEGLSHRHIS